MGTWVDFRRFMGILVRDKKESPPVGGSEPSQLLWLAGGSHVPPWLELILDLIRVSRVSRFSWLARGSRVPP